MDTVLAKTLSLVGILLFSILFGIAPIFLEKCVRSPKVHWVNNAVICFTGGTLLGITFLHLMPETRNSVKTLLNKGHFTEFPHHISIADVIICGGFFFIYIVDELIHLLLECVGADHSHQPHGRRASLLDADSCAVKADATKNTKDEATSTERGEISTEVIAHSRVLSNSIHIPSILTILALSFHDIFEGLALGIQKHDMDVIFMFVSVATHKYAISFSVSLDLLLSGITAKMILLYTICFSLVNPFGIALGICMTLFSQDGNIEAPMTVLMQGMASGSLIYVVCFEVLQRHGSSDGGHVAGIRNTVFVVVGYAFVLVTKIMMPHEHHHEETVFERSDHP